tara:strand:- start:383 stop:1003 length:621 start_codon:yes stop_codon:yes gene_type:complete
MKHALLIGCGNERGSRVIDGCKEAGYAVTNIGSSVSKLPSVTNIEIEWHDLDITKLHTLLKKIDHQIDFVFFNQNASTLSPEDFSTSKDTVKLWSAVKSWSKSHWLSTQLPYFIVHTLGQRLHSHSILGWMLSSFIDIKQNGVDKHPDYSGYKFTNYLIMKNFSKTFNCFGINPEFEKTDQIKNLIRDICLENKKCDGSVFGLTEI